MSQSLRIVIADDEARMREYYQAVLPQLGHTVVGAAQNGKELVEKCRAAKPDLVIADIKMADLDGIQAALEIARFMVVPVILVSAYHDPELMERASCDHVMAYLVKPIKQPDLAAAIHIAMQRFAHFQTLRREADDLRQALEDRKLIERAKGILMKKAGLDEQEAFHRLQQTAMDNRQKLVEVAQILVKAEEVLQPPHNPKMSARKKETPDAGAPPSTAGGAAGGPAPVP